MILNAIILILLVWGFFRGYKNGFIRQLIITLGYLLAFFVSHKYYEDLAPHLSFIPYPLPSKPSEMYKLVEALRTETVYYNALAFILIFLVAIIVIHMIASMVGGVARVPVFRQMNGLVGALLGVLQVYFLLFLILYIGVIYPVDWTKDTIHDSTIAQWILERTPILSKQFFTWMTGLLPK